MNNSRAVVPRKSGGSRLLFRFSLLTCGLLALWKASVFLFHLEPYILPTPEQVFLALLSHFSLIAHEALITILETVVGLLVGSLFGCTMALLLVFFQPLSLWLLPLVVLSQALPTFAIAPLFVIWFGYGLLSKIALTVLMLFFPIASTFYDGLRKTDSDWLDLAHTMKTKKWRLFWHIRIPAALPALASGLRMAAAIAPLGALVGEWVGSSQGLGFLMLNANAEMQIDFMFATLFIVTLFSLLLYFGMDYLLDLVIPRQTYEKV